MKKIRALTDKIIVINSMTIDRGHPMDVWNEEILDSQEVKELLNSKKIEIVDDSLQKSDSA
jgi:hypothetical protein